MPFGLRRITAPSIEPITVAQCRDHLRLDPGDSSQDLHLELLIAAAREQIEAYLGQSLIEQTWVYTLDRFPRPRVADTDYWRRPRYDFLDAIETPYYRGAVIRLPRPPLLQVVQVSYLDALGATQIVSTADYRVDTLQLPGILHPAPGLAWPVNLIEAGSVQVRYQAGYGQLAGDVPAAIRHAILLMVAMMFENRESTAEIPGGLRALLSLQMHGEYGSGT